ncbi:pancreatic lipase-related protein 3-like [Centruroides vittatus]|uniref:pancreatic lipase-related protein 3-like n=1 Tax=Centruroides vittatus TaxID=120091 RepID=UPI00350F89F5
MKVARILFCLLIVKWPHSGGTPGFQVTAFDSRSNMKRSKFNSELPTKVIVHGYVNSMLLITAMKYTQEVANARVVGAEIAFLMERLQLVKRAKLQSFHLIGHSLGAHACGYAGKRLSSLGRITALDPAGPYFRNVSSKVRLDAEDATFVDIIYTNAAESIFKRKASNKN